MKLTLLFLVSVTTIYAQAETSTILEVVLNKPLKLGIPNEEKNSCEPANPTRSQKIGQVDCSIKVKSVPPEHFDS